MRNVLLHANLEIAKKVSCCVQIIKYYSTKCNNRFFCDFGVGSINYENPFRVYMPFPTVYLTSTLLFEDEIYIGRPPFITHCNMY